MKHRLGLKLIGCAVLSLAIGIAVFLTLQFFAYSYVTDLLNDEKFINEKTEAAVDLVQAYIDDNKISSNDTDKLLELASSYDSYYYGLYKDKQLIFSSLDVFPENLDEQEIYGGNARLLHMRDCDVVAYIYIDFSELYLNLTDLACALVAFIVFTVLFILMINKRIKYIVRLENELRMLEGGKLDCPITVIGKDELGELAQGMEDMRKSFIEHEEQERDLIFANKSMITALSHDLRTPLTSLLGYIELMNSGNYSDEKQLKHFIEMSREKTLRIKDMTDRLFNYSLDDTTQNDLIATKTDAYEFTQQLMNDAIYELEAAGFQHNYEPTLFSGIVSVDAESIARVFDNIVSNIRKYGDRKKSLSIICRTDGDLLRIEFINAVAPCNSKALSTGIGLKTCRDIMNRHGGNFDSLVSNNYFMSIVTLPIE